MNIFKITTSFLQGVIEITMLFDMGCQKTQIKFRRLLWKRTEKSIDFCQNFFQVTKHFENNDKYVIINNLYDPRALLQN